MNRELLRSQIIEQYRTLTIEKYEYQRLAGQFEIPEFVSEERVEEIKKYFLEFVYPDPSMRQSLDDAFESLDGHIKAPSNLIRILMDATGILFKYGRHLPKIFKAGIKALQSFRQASGFEGMLVQAAIDTDVESIDNTTELKQLIAKLPYRDVKEFISGNDALFDALMDRRLMHKTVDIMNTLISKMQKRRSVYSDEDIAGIVIGSDILEGGIALVSDMSESQGRQLLELIKEVETDFIEEIFEKYK